MTSKNIFTSLYSGEFNAWERRPIRTEEEKINVVNPTAFANKWREQND